MSTGEDYSTIVNIPLDIQFGFLPETIVILAIILLCIFSFFKYRKSLIIGIACTSIVLAMFAVIYTFIDTGTNPTIFAGMFISDSLSLIFRFLMLLCTLIVVVFSTPYLEKNYRFEAEFYILLLTATLGAMLMSGANDLIMVFVSIETLGISSYLLTGYIRTDKLNNEASLKYLVIGSAATAILLFGMSYLYGFTGSTLFTEIAQKLNNYEVNITLFILIMFIIGGLAYKAALAPFHVWSPDVYQGAPTPYSAFLSVASKAAGFVLLIRVMTLLFQNIYIWQIIFVILAILSMFLGNLTALIQKDIKRLLAYSSIAQAGYIAIGLAVATQSSLSSMIYYLIVYLFMQLGAWCAVIMFHHQTGSNLIEDYSGLIQKRPVLTTSLTFFMLSLAGIPITAGFFAKFYIFQSAILGGESYIYLIIIALINSAISLYYYIYVVKVMILNEPSEVVKNLDIDIANKYSHTKSLSFVLGFTLAAVIFMGIFASPLIDLSKYSIEQLINYKDMIVNSVIL